MSPLKVVKKDAGLDPAASQNLLHEARASSSLAHSNICTIHEVAETDGELYIVHGTGRRQNPSALCGETSASRRNPSCVTARQNRPPLSLARTTKASFIVT